MAEEIELSEVQDIPVEEGAGIDAANAEDVVIDSSWLSSMQEKLVSTYRTTPSPFTICRVPTNISECDQAAYNPRIVSIGPFHRATQNLQAMEEHKWRYLHEILDFGRVSLEKFLKKMKAIETQARNCYSEQIEMSSEAFVEMMVLDGCFLIFFILQDIRWVKIDSLVRANYWLSGLIKLDLLLLENQLPFFVLECLWELIGQPTDKLRIGALFLFEFSFSYKLEPRSPEELVIHHLLHLLHLSLKPSCISKPRTPSAFCNLFSLRLCQYIGKTLRFRCPTYLINTFHGFRTLRQQFLRESKYKSSQPWNKIPSATELLEAGVRFRRTQARSVFEVRFEQGLMEMPRLWIYNDSDTNILFRNLMAFEQCFPDFGNHCTTYCVFIDFLVDTPRDVSILREADIITSSWISDEEVALLFNKLGKEIVWSFDFNYLSYLYKKVNQHTQKRRTKWRAKWTTWQMKLVRDYFDSPWTIIKLIAGVILLVLTFLQTYVSVFAYFRPPKP